MGSLARTVAYTMADTAYLIKDDASFRYKARAFAAYLKISFLVGIEALFGSRCTKARAFGLEWHFGDLRMFGFLFREIFVRQEYGVVLPRKRPVIFDCGANIGVATLYFKHRYPRAEVFSFEPIPENLSYLRKNIKRNKLFGVTILPVAVADRNGSTRFYVKDNERVSVMASQFQERGGDVAIKVKTVRLADLVKRRRLDVLKMDIEGAEMDVLRDLDRSGALVNVDVFMAEYHHQIGNDASLAEFLAILERNGFSYCIDAPLSRKATAPSENEDIMIYAQRKG